MSNFPFLLQAAVSYMSVSYWRGLAVFTKIDKNRFKPERRLKRCKVSNQSFFNHKSTYLIIGTNKFPKELPRT